MPSRRAAFSWLVAKEWRELVASRAWWILLALIGPLVGVSFIGAVRTYAEISAGAGAGCGIVCDPLIGIWGPTFGTYELAAVFFLPFVAIRVASGDRQSGALKLELQRPMSMLARVGAKTIVILAGWVITYAAALVAIVLWRSYGGSVALPEILVVALGHTLNAALTIAFALAIASMTEHPSTAAIVALALTIGTWIVDFEAAVHGGWWERVSSFTPAAMVAGFQHALLQVNTTAIGLVLTLMGMAVAGVWLHLGVPVGRRVLQSVGVVAAALMVAFGCASIPGYWDASETRQNSFPEPAEEALARLTAPLTIEVHLAAEDARRLELERVALAKLRRTMPDAKVVYVSRTSTGLYEQQDPGYGEIWYDLGGKRAMSRAITEEGVLETILGLAGVAEADENEGPALGHPLVARPAGAAIAFYGVWPAAIAGAYWFVSRRHV